MLHVILRPLNQTKIMRNSFCKLFEYAYSVSCYCFFRLESRYCKSFNYSGWWWTDWMHVLRIYVVQWKHLGLKFFFPLKALLWSDTVSPVGLPFLKIFMEIQCGILQIYCVFSWFSHSETFQKVCLSATPFLPANLPSFLPSLPPPSGNFRTTNYIFKKFYVGEFS